MLNFSISSIQAKCEAQSSIRWLIQSNCLMLIPSMQETHAVLFTPMQNDALLTHCSCVMLEAVGMQCNEQSAHLATHNELSNQGCCCKLAFGIHSMASCSLNLSAVFEAAQSVPMPQIRKRFDFAQSLNSLNQARHAAPMSVRWPIQREFDL